MNRLEPILEPILNSIDFESLEFKTSFSHKNRFERKSTFEPTPRVGSRSDILLSRTNYCFKANQFFFNLIVLICSTCVLNLMLIAHIFIYSSRSRADDEPKLSREPISISRLYHCIYIMTLLKLHVLNSFGINNKSLFATFAQLNFYDKVIIA